MQTIKQQLQIRRNRAFPVALIGLWVGLLLGEGCSTSTPEPYTGSNIPPLSDELKSIAARNAPPPVWTKRLNGYPSDMALDESGNELIVATIPSRDRAGGSHRNQLFWFGPQGRLKWRIEPSSPTRAVSMAGDASLAVVSDYDDQIKAFDPNGQVLWSAQATCVPFALARQRKILCYHDDDADPRVAFDIFDWRGRKIRSQSAESDIVSFKVSLDEKNVAIGLTGGVAQLFSGPQWKQVSRLAVGGEIADVAASSGESPKLAVLYHASAELPGAAPFVYWEDAPGSPAAKSMGVQLPCPGDQVTFSGDGLSVLSYGNTDAGQFFSAFSRDKKGGAASPKISAAWSRALPQGARYDSSIHPWLSLSPSSNQIITSFEDYEGGRRVSRVVSFDREGNLQWELPVETDENAYFYDLAVAKASRLFAVAIDDGRIAVFSIPR